MLSTPRTIMLSLALAAAIAPGAALASKGADDGPGDDRGGQRSGNSVEPGDDKGGQRTGSDDNPSAGDDKGGNRSKSKSKRRGKRVTGTCTGSSSAKLKVKPDDGRLETEFEVDQNVNGVTWKVRIRRNGKLAVKTNATTMAPSGSFSVERRLRNGRGKDKIVAKATSPSGEVCTSGLTY